MKRKLFYCKYNSLYRQRGGDQLSCSYSYILPVWFNSTTFALSPALKKYTFFKDQKFDNTELDQMGKIAIVEKKVDFLNKIYI